MQQLMKKLHKESNYSQWISLIKKYKIKRDIRSAMLLVDMCTLAIKDTYNRVVKDDEFFVYELQNIQSKAEDKVRTMSGKRPLNKIMVPFK